MRADADGRSARASACFRVCDVAVRPTQVRADRRARQPHAGLHSHAVCHFHPRLCIPSLPFSLRLPLSLIFPRQREQKPPPSPSPSPFPLLAANQHVLRHSNTAPRPSSVLSLSFCPISHPFADALRIIEYESPCMSASVTTLLFLGFFLSVERWLGGGCHVVTWHGRRVIKPSQQRRKSMITPSVRATMAVHFPPSTPLLSFHYPHKEPSATALHRRCLQPSTCFPPAFPPFFWIERR